MSESNRVDPFLITCQTCRSRIRVKNPAMIGQLINCPKCQSLVLVEPPDKVTVEPDHARVADSEALTKDGISVAIPMTDSDANSDRSSADQDSSTVDLLKRDNGAKDVVPAGSAETSSPGVELTDQTPLIPDQWSSPRSKTVRSYLTVAFVGITSTIVAIVLLIAFLQSQRSDGTNQLASTPAEEVQQADGGSGDSETQNQQPSAENLPHSAEDQSATQDPVNDVLQPVEGSARPEEAEQDGGVVSPSVGEEPPGAPQLDADQSDDDAGKEIAEVPSDLIEEPAQAPDPVQAAKQALPNERLRAFAPMLDWRVQPTLPDVDVKLGAPPITAEELGITEVDDQRAIPDIDWGKRSQLVLSGILFSDSISVAQGINLWTHLSGVPTVVDFAAWQAANEPLHRPMPSLKLTNLTVAEAADELARALEMRAIPVESRYLMLQPPAERIERSLPDAIPIDDLVDDDSTAAVINMMQEIFQGSDGSWQVRAGQLLRDETSISDLDWFTALQLLESWRLILGKPIRETDYQPANLDVRFPSPTDLKAIDQAVDIISPQERPFGQVLSIALGSVGIDCWIDWPNTMRAGVGPGTEITIITYRRTVRHILREVVEENDLVCAVLDAQSVWLTTPRSYRQQPRWFAIPAEGRTAEQIELEFARLSPVSSDGVRRIEVVLSPGSRVAFVKCCWPTVEFH